MTQTISFIESKFENEKDKKGIIVPSDCLNITLEMIVNKNWSLKYDDYIEKVDTNIKGIQYKPLGEVCEFDIGFTPNTPTQ